MKKNGDGDNLCEELGDLLLQVVLHSVIAQEEGLFTIEDVITGICAKMKYRHPRILRRKMKRQQRSWEELKRLEKEKRASGKIMVKTTVILSEIKRKILDRQDKRVYKYNDSVLSLSTEANIKHEHD